MLKTTVNKIFLYLFAYLRRRKLCCFKKKRLSCVSFKFPIFRLLIGYKHNDQIGEKMIEHLSTNFFWRHDILLFKLAGLCTIDKIVNYNKCHLKNPKWRNLTLTRAPTNTGIRICVRHDKEKERVGKKEKHNLGRCMTLLVHKSLRRYIEKI